MIARLVSPHFAKIDVLEKKRYPIDHAYRLEISSPVGIIRR